LKMKTLWGRERQRPSFSFALHSLCHDAIFDRRCCCGEAASEFVCCTLALCCGEIAEFGKMGKSQKRSQGFHPSEPKLDGAEKVEERPSPLNPTFDQADCREGQGEDLADRHLQGAGIHLSLGGV